MPRRQHPTLTCSTVDTSGLTGRSRYIRVLACATPTCISRQTRAAWFSGAALAALCCRRHARAPSLWSITRGHNLISGLFRRGVSSQCVPRAVPRTSRGIQQTSGPSHATKQFNKPPIPPAVYIYSGRASSSVIRTETRLGKWACHAAPAASNAHLLHSRHKRSLLLHSRTCLRNTDSISRQTRAAWSSGIALAALCCKAACSHVTSLLTRSLWCRL
jgi:hypothetical protein